MARGGTIIAVAFGLLSVALFLILQANARQADERREKLNLVATVATLAIDCPDDRRPYYVTIRNIARRTALAASFQLREDPMPAGTLPSDIPTVSLKAPLPAGQAISDCHALNRNKLFARGIEPRSVHLVPMLVLDSVVFE